MRAGSSRGSRTWPGEPSIVLNGPSGVGGTLEFKTAAPSGVKASLALALNNTKVLDGSDVKVGLTASSGMSLFLPVAPPAPVSVTGDLDLGINLSKSNPAGVLVIGSDALGAKLAIGELGVALRLKNSEPRMAVFVRQAKATIKPTDAFLKLILGEGITFDFAVEAEADKAGQLRLTNGTGLRASLPLPTLADRSLQAATHQHRSRSDRQQLPASPGRAVRDRSASNSVPSRHRSIGWGSCSISTSPTRRDRSAFAFKPPNGIGLVLDAGIIKGGGYLGVDADGYAGVLELKMLAVGVKAIAILNTKSEAGFSLLLLIFGQFPAIQLSFGFTLTGVGGLIGVQHTASPTALSQGIGNGSLDAVLFPENPVGDAPRIINTLRTCFRSSAAASSSARCWSSAGARRASSRCGSAC